VNFNKLELFQAQGPYFRNPDGELDPDLPEYGVGECQSMGNRGGGNEEGKGMPGFVVVGPKQIAWAAEWMTGFLQWQPAERFVGHAFCSQLIDVSWHRGTILRFTYRAPNEGSSDGLFLAEFVDHESVLAVKQALEWQMEAFPSA
jgi:hypothetical protein